MQTLRLSARDCCGCSLADFDSGCGDRSIGFIANSRFPLTLANTAPLVTEGEGGFGFDSGSPLLPASAGEFDLEGRSFLLSVFKGREFGVEGGSLLPSVFDGVGFSLGRGSFLFSVFDEGFCLDGGPFLLPAFEEGRACLEGKSALFPVSEEAREFGLGSGEGSFLVSFEGEVEIGIERRSVSFLLSACEGRTHDGLYKTRNELPPKDIRKWSTHLVNPPCRLGLRMRR